MSSSDNLFKAIINRVSARISHKTLETIEQFSIKAKTAPKIILEEWHLFQEEVAAEAERLDKENDSCEKNQPANNQQSNRLQTQIDNIRSDISRINKKLEDTN